MLSLLSTRFKNSITTTTPNEIMKLKLQSSTEPALCTVHCYRLCLPAVKIQVGRLVVVKRSSCKKGRPHLFFFCSPLSMGGRMKQDFQLLSITILKGAMSGYFSINTFFSISSLSVNSSSSFSISCIENLIVLYGAPI